jgi:DNA-binding MarR family transcriptional regulator
MMVSELGERLALDSGTLTPLLKRLEAAGLVARVRSVDDERRVHITLTAAGRRLKSKAQHVPACIVAATRCSLPEIVRLTRELRDLRERLAA